MGGHISLGIRRENGEFSTTGVWTNSLKWALQDARFMEGDLEPVDEFLERYLKNGDDCFGPQETTPGEYGFVLVDAVDRVVINFNRYSKVLMPRLTDLGIDPTGNNGEFEVAVEPGDVEYRDFVRKYVTKVTQLLKDPLQTIEVNFDSFPDDQSLIRFSESLHRDEYTFMTHFHLTSPFWTIRELNNRNPGDFRSLWDQVEKCVRLTDRERQGWKRYHKAAIRQKKSWRQARRESEIRQPNAYPI